MSNRYLKALTYAHELHIDQKRKGTNIPYISHLMHVSSYVLEFGGDEDQAIAGLLHDSIEDQGERTSYIVIRNIFGEEVERIVRACTDVESFPKPPWEERKRMYLNNLEAKDNRVKLVVACDKLHNAQSIVRDVTLEGEHCWSRFSADRKRIFWYYSEIAKNLQSLGSDSTVLKLLTAEVEKMKTLV
jgi:(p)ppGpp synthase/HD superfamily hydrolase